MALRTHNRWDQSQTMRLVEVRKNKERNVKTLKLTFGAQMCSNDVVRLFLLLMSHHFISFRVYDTTRLHLMPIQFRWHKMIDGIC